MDIAAIRSPVGSNNLKQYQRFAVHKRFIYVTNFVKQTGEAFVKYTRWFCALFSCTNWVYFLYYSMSISFLHIRMEKVAVLL